MEIEGARLSLASGDELQRLLAVSGEKGMFESVVALFIPTFVEAVDVELQR